MANIIERTKWRRIDDAVRIYSCDPGDRPRHDGAGHDSIRILRRQGRGVKCSEHRHLLRTFSVQTKQLGGVASDEVANVVVGESKFNAHLNHGTEAGNWRRVVDLTKI